MPKFEKSPLLDKCCLDEQMYLSDPQRALLFQIREEAKETNYLLRKLVDQKESTNEVESAELKPPEVKKTIAKKDKKPE